MIWKVLIFSPWCLVLPVTFPGFWWLFQEHQMKLLPQSLSWSITFFQFTCKILIFVYFIIFLLFSPLWSTGMTKVFFFLLINTILDFLIEIHVVCTTKSQRIFIKQLIRKLSNIESIKTICVYWKSYLMYTETEGNPYKQLLMPTTPMT